MPEDLAAGSLAKALGDQDTLHHTEDPIAKPVNPDKNLAVDALTSLWPAHHARWHAASGFCQPIAAVPGDCNSRCGRACFFCRPSGEAVTVDLAPDDLVRVATVVRRTGIGSIKLTGGDPALYEPLEETVLRLRRGAQFDEIEVISRHPLIGSRAADLAEAGVTQFNMSVDTLDPVLHHEICGVDDLPAVLDALGACVATGVPVKVNTVVMAGVNDHEVATLAAFCERVGVHTLKLLDVIKDLEAGTESFAAAGH